MIFIKSAFSIKIQKTMNFPSIFGGQSEENSNKNWFKNVLFLSIAFSAFFSSIWGPFWKPKIIKNFHWNFLRFGLRKWKENSLFFGSLSKKLILLKSLFFQKKIAIFLVSSLQKWTKFRCFFFLFENK